MKKLGKWIGWTATALIFALCPVTAGGYQKKVNVVATIAQIGQPLSVIAADRANIVTLMREGVDPHLYRLTRWDVAKLNQADMIVYNGLNLEAQLVDMLTRFSVQKPVIGIADTLKDRNLLLRNGKAHDPHVWMDPTLWIIALSAAVRELAIIDPPNAQFYQKSATAYFSRVNDLHERAKTAIASIPLSSRALVTAHDAFGYFGHAYAIDVLAIQGISTESEAGIHQIESLVKTLVNRRIKAVFMETTVSENNIRALIEGASAQDHEVQIGGALYSDAMGRKGTYTGQYLGMFDHNITTIIRALGGKAPLRGFGGRLTQKEGMW